MTGTTAVALASLVHSLFRVSIFLELPRDACSPAPSLASWLFFSAMVLLISDIEVYPRRYAFIPNPSRIFAEFVIALIILEFSTIFFWCTIEKLTYDIMKGILMEASSNMYYDMGGDALVGVLITICSFFILVNVSLATEVYYEMKYKFCKFVKIYSDIKERTLSSTSTCPQIDVCPSQSGIESDGLYDCPHIHTRRRAQSCKSNRRSDARRNC